MSSEIFREAEEETARLIIARGETEEVIGGIIGIRMGPYNAALYRRRVEYGFSQKGLAEAIGYKTATSISRIETLREYPNPDKARRITEVLGTTPETIFPPWLQLFTRDIKQPAQIRIELTESEIGSAALSRIQRIAGELGPAFDPHEEAAREEDREFIRKALEVINPREAQVLRLRYGFDNNQERTLDEIAEIMGVSRERVRQLQVKGENNFQAAVLKDRLKEQRTLLDECRDSLDSMRPGGRVGDYLNRALNSLTEGRVSGARLWLDRAEQVFPHSSDPKYVDYLRIINRLNQIGRSVFPKAFLEAKLLI